MSSTNRDNKTVQERHDKSDYYFTPAYAIQEFIDNSLNVEKIDWSKLHILDPASGGLLNSKGEIIQGMSYPDVLKSNGVKDNNLITLDIREDSLSMITKDYFDPDFFIEDVDMIITNPPFLYAMHFIKKSLEIVNNGGYVIMLLRLNFFGSIKRHEFFKKNMPKYVFIHHKRLSFTEDGSTDSIEYMHAVWQKGYKTEFTKTKVI